MVGRVAESSPSRAALPDNPMLPQTLLLAAGTGCCLGKLLTALEGRSRAVAQAGHSLEADGQDNNSMALQASATVTSELTELKDTVASLRDTVVSLRDTVAFYILLAVIFILTGQLIVELDLHAR